MSALRKVLVAAVTCLFLVSGIALAESTKDSDAEEKSKPKLVAEYDNALKLSTDDGRYSAKINFRGQFRVTDQNSSGLPMMETEALTDSWGTQVRRSRFKISGNLYKKWITYKLEYAFEGNRLIDFYAQLQPKDEFGVRFGQWKIPFNRERVDSSGAQQFVERSVVNRPFTVDRQQGLTFQGRLFKGTHAESRYWIGAYNGTGRGGALDRDSEPLYLARYQWNFLAEDLKFSQSDVKRRDKAAGSLAIAKMINTGVFTRFSSSGGGQLPGFDLGIPGQYELDQTVTEFAYQYAGLSIQSEYHEKEIDDTVNGGTTELDGLYAQAGYFFHELFEAFPEPLEIAFRYARVDSEKGIMQPEEREHTVAVNWFFNGHKNKLTFDLSDLERTLPGGTTDDAIRGRLQWDVSF